MPIPAHAQIIMAKATAGHSPPKSKLKYIRLDKKNQASSWWNKYGTVVKNCETSHQFRWIFNLLIIKDLYTFLYLWLISKMLSLIKFCNLKPQMTSWLYSKN